MALQIWLPLTKDLRNQGLSSIVPINNGNIIYSSIGGKFGGCYVFDGVDDAITVGNLSTLVTDSFSFACWFYHDDTWSSKNFETLFGGPSGFELEAKNGGTNSPVLRLYNWCSSTCAYELNKWNHVVFTRNTTETKLYLNGELKLTGTAGTIPSGNYFVGSWSSTTSQNFKGKMNDVRIYDHCLSPMEIKKLSQGLVLHYPLSDKFLEGTTNLVTSITSGGQTTWANNILTTSGTNADTYFTLNLSENIVNGTQYTISCDAEDIPQGTCWTFPLGQQGNTALSFQIYNGHNEYTFTANNISWGTKRCFMDDGGSPNSARATGAKCKIYNFQIEKKDHATGFAGYGGTRNVNTVYDCSGFVNNGTINGSLTISDDTPKYSVSTKFPNNCNTWIANTDFPQIAKNLTFACWCKIQQGASSSFSFIVSQGRDNIQSGFNIILNGTEYALHGSFGALKSGVTVDNTWKHIVGTYDGTTIKIYINGELKNSMNYTSDLTYTYGPALVIGKMAYSYTSTANYFPTNGNISDVRIYATALSASDVKSLYQNCATIDPDGTIHGQIRS